MARVWFVRNRGGLWAGDNQVPATDLIVCTHEIVPWPEEHRLMLQGNAIFSAGVLAGTKILSWAQNALLFESAKEVFVSSTTREVAGVSLIQSQDVWVTVGSGAPACVGAKREFSCPGKVTRKLAQAFKAYVKSRIVAAAPAPIATPG
jgi:hypothetical protein